MSKPRDVLVLTSWVLALAVGFPAAAQVWRSDQGDGTFRNPVLYADYPDPDVIRVGTEFYMVSTTFVNTPGIVILRSKDLINWSIAGHVAPRLDARSAYDLSGGGAYRRGFYAASLRHHGGKFHVVVTPVGQNTRIYSAPDIDGPWTSHELDRQAFDPGLFFDDDGKGYVVTAFSGDGAITLLTLNADLTAVTDSRQIHDIRGAEGSKLIKRNGWYYLFNAIPRRLGMTVSRSRSLTGPWETRDQIDDKSGGHQGALVDLPDGRDFGFVMVDAGAIGRTTNLSPVHWVDGWPVWGTVEAPGRVPERAVKPIPGFAFTEPPSSDDFSAARLGPQWAWNHNPDDARWSLGDRPGFLRLRATTAPEFWLARNTLTQKAQGPRGRATVKIDIGRVRPGDRCGFGLLGQVSAQLAVGREGGGHASLAMTAQEDKGGHRATIAQAPSVPIMARSIWLRMDLDFIASRGAAAYSVDGRRWTSVGPQFPLAFGFRTGTFQGEQFALFCYAPNASPGFVDVDSFTLAPGPSLTLPHKP